VGSVIPLAGLGIELLVRTRDIAPAHVESGFRIGIAPGADGQERVEIAGSGAHPALQEDRPVGVADRPSRGEIDVIADGQRRKGHEHHDPKPCHDCGGFPGGSHHPEQAVALTVALDAAALPSGCFEA